MNGPKKYSREFLVGCFVLIGLVAIGWLTLKLGKMDFFSQNAYTVQARFSSVSGLRVGAEVEIAGVAVGKVSNITVDIPSKQAVLTLRIFHGVEIPGDSTATIKTSGLIGDRFILIDLGDDEIMLAEGQSFANTQPAMELDNIIEDVKEALGSIGIASIGLTLEAEESYTLTASFTSIAGLRAGADVQIAGVSVGKVEEIGLNLKTYNAVITVRIKNGIALSDDTIASIRSTGLIGSKYLLLSPGGSPDILGSGDEISDTSPSVDLESLIGKYAFGGVE